MDKIGLSHYAAAIQAAAAMQQQQLQQHGNGGSVGGGGPPQLPPHTPHHIPTPPTSSHSNNGPLLSPAAPPVVPGAPGSVEAVTLPVVHDVASLIFYGTHAIPIRLKILLDRLFSVLGQPAVTEILKRFGWTMEDYTRGYATKVSVKSN